MRQKGTSGVYLAGEHAQRARRRGAGRLSKLESRTLNGRTGAIEHPVPIRGRWLRPDHTGLRNAAWGVRNARWAGQDEAMMLAWLCSEARQLLIAGEPVESVVPSIVDLFMKP